MNPVLSAVRIGLGRGWTEFRHVLAMGQEYVFTLMTSGIILIVLYVQRDNTIVGTSLPLATLALPGVIGALVAFNTLTAARSRCRSSVRTAPCCGPRPCRSAWWATSAGRSYASR